MKSNLAKKGQRLHIVLNEQSMRQMKILAAFLGGTRMSDNKFKELPKVQVIEKALDSYFKSLEQKMMVELYK
mgnify:CR=1 FL=1